jgi:hypothetical protein
MKIIATLLLACCLLPALSFSQELTVFVGMSQSSMNSLRQARSLIASAVLVELKTTDDFPPYLRYGMTMLFDLNEKMKLGGQLSTTSTGSRATYQDYSGSITFDQKVKNISIGVHFEYEVYAGKKSVVGVYGQQGPVFSMYQSIFDFQVSTESQHADEKYYATGYYFEFGGTYAYRVSDRFSLVGNLGYQLNTGGQIESEEDEPLYYINNGHSINWTGLKVHAGVTYHFR